MVQVRCAGLKRTSASNDKESEAMTHDPFAQFKAMQREGWALFAPLATFTTLAAAPLVEYAGVQSGQNVLDVACGTGVVAVTAARRGARVRGLDLAPKLLEEARRNAAIAGVSIEFLEGDAEALPYPDGSFDVVLSQFGHMFAPQPDIAMREMFRVLKAGGRIAFSTWPPELFMGQMFTLVSRYQPPPPGAAPPSAWGDPNVVRERLSRFATDIEFDRNQISIPALSPQHFRATTEVAAAPVAKLVSSLEADPRQLAKFRAEFDALIETVFAQNRVRQSFLMTRAAKL
jgi:SAM-dependent methyltransferase